MKVDGLRPGPPAAGDVEVGAGFAAGDVGRLRRGRWTACGGGPAALGDVSGLRPVG